MAGRRWLVIGIAALVGAGAVAIAAVLPGSAGPATPSEPSGSVVRAAVETVALPGSGDIADDTAVWLNPAAPEASVVIADSKSETAGGIIVFDMAGKMLQFLPSGKIGNVDLRGSFPLGGKRITLVGANNRTNDQLEFYSLDAATRQLTPVNAHAIPAPASSYGFCLYASKAGKFYANVTSQDGHFEQWELSGSSGRVDARKVRSFAIGSIAEGCVADDELGSLYIAEEDRAIWKYGAEPGSGNARTSVDTAGGAHLTADIEGLSLSYGPDQAGYLFASSQGSSKIVVYDRRGNNAFVKDLTVTENGDIDAVTDTDGIDVVAGDLGPGFRHGVMVVHDEFNAGGPTSNLKYVPLEQVIG